MGTTKKKASKITGLIILVVVVSGLVVGGIFSKQLETFAKDLISNMHYSGSPEIEEIANKLGLTGSGRFVFGATNPAVEERDAFNEHCDSYDEETSTLGCYGDNRIYLYNVTADELAGIKESTAAHELMHAVWERMPDGEKNELSKLLLNTYDNDKDIKNRLEEELKNYEEDEIVDELHSRLATEVKNLPARLEEHYAKYFTDQDAVVVLYENYREPFEKLDEEFEKLSADLEAVKAEYEQKQNAYVERYEALEEAISEFNSCAETLGCFSSQAAFNARRNELVAENAALDEMYNELSVLVDDYNAKVEAYNNNILRGEELDSMMNSNSKVNL